MEDGVHIEPSHDNDHLLRKKKLKNKKIKRITTRICALILTIAVLIAGIFFLVRGIRDSYFDVKHITVMGNQIVDRQRVIEAAKVPTNTCIFILDTNQVYQNITESIDCQRLVISKKFPDTLVINIDEKPAFCAMIEGENTYYLDYEFRLIESSDYLGRSDLPVVTGLSGAKDVNVGQQVVLQPVSDAESIKSIMTIIANSGYDQIISEYIINKDGSIEIITKNNLSIKVSDLDHFKANYDYIGSVLSKNKSNLDMDLTSGNKPIVKKR